MKKRFLSLLLVLSLLSGLFVVPVSATGVTDGAGDSGGSYVSVVKYGTGGGKPNWKGSSGPQVVNDSSRGYVAVRMKAVPVKEPIEQQDYFTADTTEMKIYELDWKSLTNVQGYNTSAGWKYFRDGSEYKAGSSNFDGNESWPLVQYFGDTAVRVDAYRVHSPEYMRLINIFTPYGASKNTILTDAAQLSALFNTNVPEDKVEDVRYELGKYFGLSDEDAHGTFYIVAEQIINAQFQIRGENGYGINWTDTYPTLVVNGAELITSPDFSIGMSKASFFEGNSGVAEYGFPTCIFDSNGSISGVSLVSGTGKWYSKKFEGETYFWKQRENEAPWKSMGYTMGSPITDGYTLYSFGDLSTVLAAGNVAVEYQGDVNTSEPSKFVSTGSLINSGSTSGMAYYDFLGSKWVDSADEAELLQFTGRIDTSEEYGICFTSTTDYVVTGDSQLKSSMNSVFKDVPGDGYTSQSLTWGQYPVTSKPANAGSVWKVSLLEGYANTYAIKDRFVNAFNSVADGTLVQNGAYDTTAQFKDAEVLDGCWDNAMKAGAFSEQDVLENGAGGKATLKDTKHLGFGYEFIIRGTPVTSRKITIKIDGEADASGQLTNLSVNSAETWYEDYTTARETSCVTQADVGYTFVTWFVVPGQDDSITGIVEGSLGSLTQLNNGIIQNAVYSAVDPAIIETKGNSPTEVGLGSTDDQPPIGYTVYEIMYKSDIPVMPVTGAVILPAYMLNRYFDNIIQTSSTLKNGFTEKFTLARDWTWVSWIYGSAHCCFTAPVAYKDDWVIEYYDAASGNEFALDNAKLDYYYPRGTGTWVHAKRSDLTHAWQISMDTRSMPENTHVVDYAFNLVRGNADFGDKRSISGISYSTYVNGTGDSQNLLLISDKFGVTPSGVKNASPVRNSLAPLATYTETFNIKSRFQHTASDQGEHVLPKVRHGVHWHSHGRGRGCNCSLWYYPGKFAVTCMGFYGAYSGSCNTISYSFDNTAFKYTTKNDLGSGQNDFLGGSSSKPLTSGRRNATAGSITPSNFYRFSTTRYTGVDLKFHPENLMVFKIGGTDFDSINALQYSMANVMSEVKRTSKSSGLYFFRLNADVTGIPGTVYSDSMLGGTGVFGMGSTVSIPAGSDVTIAADPSGVAIDLYGYALDLVQVDDDGKIGAVGSGRAYRTVVKSGLNAYNEWGNSTSHADILRHFNAWCDDMLKVENYAADFQLYVGSGSSSLKSENFSATIGRVDRGTAGTVEEGIYQLVVRKGILQESEGDYNALIRQIATDYGCSNAEAKAMFTESALYTAIINGMETCKNPKNNSKPVEDGISYRPDILSSWTDSLGGDGNWYDETSQTFVVRRFTNLGNKLCDVIATDKIDYQLAPEGNSRPGENINSGSSYDAWWHLNIFFDQDASTRVNDLLLGSSRYYDPQNGNSGFSQANNAYSVMFNSIPVLNADFKIPASSTQDFYN